jgi:hypothetical protein
MRSQSALTPVRRQNKMNDVMQNSGSKCGREALFDIWDVYGIDTWLQTD